MYYKNDIYKPHSYSPFEEYYDDYLRICQTREMNILLRGDIHLFERQAQENKGLISNSRYNYENKESVSFSLLPYDLVVKDLDIFSFVDKRKNEYETSRFKVNTLYKLKKFDEDIEMNEQVYELVAILKKSEYITSDTLIMKLVSGPNHGIYSLTKMDCKLLGIQHSDGLQLFSPQLQWEEISSNKENNASKIYINRNGYITAFIKINDYHAINKEIFVSSINHGSCQYSLKEDIPKFEIKVNGLKTSLTRLIFNDINDRISEMIFEISFKMNPNISDNNIEVWFKK